MLSVNGLLKKTPRQTFDGAFSLYSVTLNSSVFSRVLFTHLTQFLENARVFPHPSPLPKGEGTPVPFGGRVGDEGA